MSLSTAIVMNSQSLYRPIFLFMVAATLSGFSQADDLTNPAQDTATVAAQARLRGDARRGSLLFHKSAAACVKCHATGQESSPLGPDLTTIAKDATDQYIVEAILDPSKAIRKGFESVTVLTTEGQTHSGLVALDTKEVLVLRDATNLQQEIRIARDDIDEIRISQKSMMPEGLANTLGSDQDLYDLVRYVTEIARGGAARAESLRPDPSELMVSDDSIGLDHAGILRSLGKRDFEAGRDIFQNQCKACHGADGNSPTLPTARAFGKEPFKYGADPYKMLLTLTRGAGLMTPMQQLSPKERYQVVHYIREAMMKPSNPAYRESDEDYLNSLPKGSGNGEEVISNADRDFGPVLGSQIGSSVNNALTFRLPDAVTVSYDLHRMRLAGAWTGGFLDLSQTHHYRQRGEQMPKVDGEMIPGLSEWQWMFNGSFEIPGDAKPPRGPVRPDWLQYHGHYLHDDRAVLSYGIHGREILESIRSSKSGDQLLLHHTLRINGGEQALKLSVAKLPNTEGPTGLIPPSKTTVAGRSGWASNQIAIVSGVSRSRSGEASMANKPRHVVAGSEAKTLDLGTPSRTILVRFRTTGDGTLVASAPSGGLWKPNGKSLFLRGGRLVFDIGWVGALNGTSIVNDGQWHLAALVVANRETRLYVDGKLEAKQEGFRREPENGHVLKIGATATNFGGDFTGDIDWLAIHDGEFTADELVRASSLAKPPERKSLYHWTAKLDKTENASKPPEPDQPKTTVAAAVFGDTDGLTWDVEADGRITLSIPASSAPRVIEIVRASATGQELSKICNVIRTATGAKPVDPLTMTRGGTLRWPQTLKVHGKLGEPINGYALDTIPIPFENPWNAWIRTSALDFFDDGRAVVTTHGGDVYIVSGIDDRLETVVWKRYAAGLFEPFGVRVVNGEIYVTCRDGIKRLHDFNKDGEADFVEAFWIDDDVSSSFHAYNFDLQTDSHGNFFFSKAGQYSQHGRPGTIMRVPPEGGRADVVAWGLRTPNGMGKLNDDRFTVSDNQGPWMPAGKISLIKQDSFLGNMPINSEQTQWLKEKHGGELPESFDEPIIWTPQELDNSCGGQTWVDDARFGPLSGRLLHSSFGKGWLYYLSLQDIGEKTQASIVALPHQWDAGVMRLRMNPADGQLYGTGLSGWQGPAGGKDGCLQRLRYAKMPIKMIENVRVIPGGLELRFSFDVDPLAISDSNAWRAEMWDYLWSKQYGSDEYSILEPGAKHRDALKIEKLFIVDAHTIRLSLPEMRVCDQLALDMKFLDSKGELFIEKVFLTIHEIPTGLPKDGETTVHSEGLHGYIGFGHEPLPAERELTAGMGFYAAVWPLLDKPLAGLQIGLPSAWIQPDNSDNKDTPLAPEGTLARQWKERGPTWSSVFQTVEGGLGYWGRNHFRYGPPKFSMNATPQCYDYEVGSPGWSFFYSNEALPDDRLGVAQLSNRLLIPPDGLPFAGNPNGEFLGYTWMALPFTTSVDEQPPTGDQSWTCFLNTKNFKGPIAYYIPETWSKIGKIFNYPFIYGRGLDARPGLMGGGAMEINTVPRVDGIDQRGVQYSKIPALHFPVDENGRSYLVQDVTYYSKSALFHDFASWRDGGSACSGQFNEQGAWRPRLTTRTTEYQQAGKKLVGVEKTFDTRIFEGNVWGLEWFGSEPESRGLFPQYYRHNADGHVAVSEARVPNETKLHSAEFRLAKPGDTYTSPSSGAWVRPGAQAGPFTAELLDGSIVTYSWYRFVDQPSFQQYQWSDAKKAKLQAIVESLHANWTIDRDYMAPPTRGELVSLDPGLIVSPPPGLEFGYVPIVTKQHAAKP